ncbi:hypothetical protein GCM10012287_48550 [Streptomyces daqingensis]|uniref:Uncharacterized protein n=1 Tax=Streptomyces daqingensis TaxID=1472640 RepID=A0ABQ2MPF2_9ACTN|nr:hypothetical protein [Streptomyces daqingensis]GGO55994.1 hypothetical protein GCM10012287_48550 [Streptomyces daqingensis]
MILDEVVRALTLIVLVLLTPGAITRDPATVRVQTRATLTSSAVVAKADAGKPGAVRLTEDPRFALVASEVDKIRH